MMSHGVSFDWSDRARFRVQRLGPLSNRRVNLGARRLHMVLALQVNRVLVEWAYNQLALGSTLDAVFVFVFILLSLNDTE